MYNGTITFNKIIAPINRRKFKKIVDKYGGDIGVKGFTCWHHFISILFGQIANCNSLRTIENTLQYQQNSHYHLGIKAKIARSTISYANKTRNWCIYRDLFFELLQEVKLKDMTQSRQVITLLDASPINLFGRGHEWAEKTLRITGLKLHMLYNLDARLPIYFDITGAKTNDINIGRHINIKAGSTYVFDKGYADYNWWYSIDRQKAYFVTRLKSNAKKEVLEERAVCGAILQDATIRIGSKTPRGGKHNDYCDKPLRMIVVNREDNTLLTLVTNDFVRTSEEIAVLYKQRWQIELFFKWIKQNLKIKRFLSRNENAIKTQICIALIYYVLLRIAQVLKTVCAKLSLSLLHVIVSNTVFVKDQLRSSLKRSHSHPHQLLFNFNSS